MADRDPATGSKLSIVATTLAMPERLDKFIFDHKDKVNISRSRIQKLIEQGNCTINGTAVKKSAKVRSLPCYNACSKRSLGQA